MTEDEWRNCNDPTPMLEFVDHRFSDRKFRLFANACGRRICGPEDGNVWNFLDLSDRLADGLDYSTTALKAVDIRGPFGNVLDRLQYFAEYRDAYIAFVTALRAAEATGRLAEGYPERFLSSTGFGFAVEEEKTNQAVLMRCVFNPFRSQPIPRDWLSSSVLSMAQSAYETGDFTALPVLADALEEAGCTDAEILNHCRRSGPHVRGCWVVDWVLQKE